jgi:hypothetical protein
MIVEAMIDHPFRFNATNRVFDRLGELIGNQMLDLLKYHLKTKHDISVDANNRLSCSLVELHTALEDLLGEEAADMLLEAIYLELEAISEKPAS